MNRRKNYNQIINEKKIYIYMHVLFVRFRYILAPSYAMLGCCASSSFLARTSHINVSANSLAMVCVDPEDPDETRRECLLRRLNRGIKLAEDIGLAIGTFNIFFNFIIQFLF